MYTLRGESVRESDTLTGTADRVGAAASLLCAVHCAALPFLLAILPAFMGQKITVVRILGWIFAPLAWAIGIPWKEAPVGGALLGTKLVLTEFTAFIKLGGIPVAEMSERTRLIMTYALCGFANIGSVGINVAGYSVLVPSRRPEVMGMVWKALLAGFLATCMTAALVGLMPSALFAH